ncbi:MAG TPA: hypothetical protein VEA19_04385 [Actinomycetota bacterium]|nr:hypothetical protein [Actinomycetota bacterium]
MPRAGEALEHGEISMSAVRILERPRDTDPDAFREAEELLVEAARIHPISDLKKERSTGSSGSNVSKGCHPRKIREQRRLHASVTFLGMVRVDGNLDPETGETLLTALNAGWTPRRSL